MDSERISALDAEGGVAGAILVDGGSYQRVAEYLTDDSFSLELPREIFRAAASLTAKGTAIDPVAIREEIRAEHGTVTDQMLMELMDVTPTAANDVLYAQIVQEKHFRRRLKELGEALYERDESPADLIAFATSALEEMQETKAGGACRSSAEVLTAFYEDLQRRDKGKRNTVSTGYENLDRILGGGGMVKGGLYILAARPAMGKTSLALNIAEQIEGGVLFVSLEMSENEVMAKRMARESGLSSNLLLAGTLTEREYEQAAGATKRIYASQMHINRRPTATVTEIGLMARSVKGLRCIVVDYLGLIRPEGKSKSRYEEVSDISGALKRLARQLCVPVLALAQLNRSVEARTDKRPMMSDLRDSGSIEQDADGVMLLYRPDYYATDSAEKEAWDASLVECNVAKNRHGRCGTAFFDAYLATNRFMEIRKG